jgi:hypothetical protein
LYYDVFRFGIFDVSEPSTDHRREYRVGNQTFAEYKALAAKATQNVPATSFKGGVLGSIPAASAAKPPT